MKKLPKTIAAFCAMAFMISSLAATALADTTMVVINEKVFPDEGFRNFVSTKYDTNKSGTLEQSEISNVSYMFITADDGIIEDTTGIEFFKDLTSLTINTDVKIMNLGKSSKLTNLEVSGCRMLTTLDVSKLRSLEYLTLANSGIRGINLDSCYNLKQVKIENCPLVSMEFGTNPALTSVTIKNSDLESINFGRSNSISMIELSGEKLASVDTSGLTVLDSLSVSGAPMSAINLSSNSSLTYLKFTDSKITSLDLGKNTKLQVLKCDSPKMSFLNISANTAISELDIAGSGIHTLNISSNAYLMDTYNQGTPATTDGITQYTHYPNNLGYSSIKCNEGTTFATSNVTGVEGFAERLYTTCLGRASEVEGRDYWASCLKSGMSGAEVAKGFFFSPEIAVLQLDDVEFITRLYRTFMNREPDKAGIDYWLSQIAAGYGREFVFGGFVNSVEWADICLDYSIMSGSSTAPSHEKVPNQAIVNFAKRLYTTCLGRNADGEGVKYWSVEIANMRMSGSQVAYGFFFSDEFESLDLDNEEFVTRLYLTFMNREPDEEGLNYWVGTLDELEGDKTRKDVFDGFACAPEFASICAEAGIIR